LTSLDLGVLRDAFERRRREVMLAAAASALLLVVGAALYWWFAVRWKPPPSIFDSPVSDVLGYLALPDFNQLPIEERMRFLLELADRFRGFDPGESAAAAAFLAAVVGPAREQVHENARMLAKDVLASAAAEYLELPESERAAFIDDWLVEWMRLGERLTRGKERDRTDDERLEAARRDMRRNRENMAEREEQPAMSDRSASRFLDFWQREVETASSPREQGQIVRFMEDVRKHLGR